METQTALQQMGQMLWQARWDSIKVDMNNDGSFTITDVWMWMKWVFTFPGDVLLIAAMIYLPGVALFLEIRPNVVGRWLSLLLSFYCWSVATGTAISHFREDGIAGLIEIALVAAFLILVAFKFA